MSTGGEHRLVGGLPAHPLKHHRFRYRGHTVVVYHQSRFIWNARVLKDGHLLCTYMCGDPFDAFTAAGAERKAKRHIDSTENYRDRESALDVLLKDASNG